MSGPKSREETPKKGMHSNLMPHRNNMPVRRTKSKPCRIFFADRVIQPQPRFYLAVLIGLIRMRVI